MTFFQKYNSVLLHYVNYAGPIFRYKSLGEREEIGRSGRSKLGDHVRKFRAGNAVESGPEEHVLTGNTNQFGGGQIPREKVRKAVIV